jgi:hypothetical protein
MVPLRSLARLSIAAVLLVEIVPAFAQQPDAAMSEALLHLRDVRTQAEAKASAAAATAPSPTPTSHVTRPSENAANSMLLEAQISHQLLVPGSHNALKAIYDRDDRKNYDHPQLTSAQRRAADATAILVKSRKIVRARDGKTVSLPGGNVIDQSSGTGLCTPAQAAALNKPREPFYDEPNPGFCSAVRISKNRVATAGHCIRTVADCKETSIIFGFYHSSTSAHPEEGIPVENVFSCQKVVAGNEDDAGADWRVVEVDRNIAVGSEAVLRTSASTAPLQVGAELTVVGYPLGLPVKIADGAKVRALGKGFFVANLDTYEGNSGSAVFSSARLTEGELFVEGLLVRGESDFDVTTPCYISKRCPADGCRGEDVTVANEIASTPAK